MKGFTGDGAFELGLPRVGRSLPRDEQEGYSGGRGNSTKACGVIEHDVVDQMA